MNRRGEPVASPREDTAAFRLRHMTEADLSQVMKVELTSYEFPWTKNIFLDCLRAGYCCLVLEDRDEIIGYGVMSMGGGEAHVLNLCVRGASRGRGYARRMLQELMRRARAAHADTLFLEVRPSNTHALALYVTEGFNEVGIRRGYYPAHGGREDALVLARILSPTEPD